MTAWKAMNFLQALAWADKSLSRRFVHIHPFTLEYEAEPGTEHKYDFNYFADLIRDRSNG